MFTKIKYYSVFFIFLMILFFSQIIYLQSNSYSEKVIENKNSFTTITGLPDLAISTEADYMRHRSLALRSDIFKDGPEHIEYMPTTFIYNRNTYEK